MDRASPELSSRVQDTQLRSTGLPGSCPGGAPELSRCPCPALPLPGCVWIPLCHVPRNWGPLCGFPGPRTQDRASTDPGVLGQAPPGTVFSEASRQYSGEPSSELQQNLLELMSELLGKPVSQGLERYTQTLLRRLHSGRWLSWHPPRDGSKVLALMTHPVHIPPQMFHSSMFNDPSHPTLRSKYPSGSPGDPPPLLLPFPNAATAKAGQG